MSGILRAGRHRCRMVGVTRRRARTRARTGLELHKAINVPGYCYFRSASGWQQDQRRSEEEIAEEAAFSHHNARYRRLIRVSGLPSLRSWSLKGHSCLRTHLNLIHVVIDLQEAAWGCAGRRSGRERSGVGGVGGVGGKRWSPFHPPGRAAQQQWPVQVARREALRTHRRRRRPPPPAGRPPGPRPASWSTSWRSGAA